VITIDLQTPFQTLLDENPDYCGSDVQAECQRLFARQKAIASLIEGNLDPDTLLDLLSDQGLDPSVYIDEVVDNVDFLIQRFS
jgi:hypothetical protein